MSRSTVICLLEAILQVLETAEETNWMPAIEQHTAAIRAASEERGYQVAVRETLRLFGGAGSFQDLVLQNENGVLPEQSKLSILRDELFSALRDELA